MHLCYHSLLQKYFIVSAIEQILALSDKTISFSLVNDNKAIEEQPTIILPEL